MRGTETIIEPDFFRRVLGQFPTGVAVITAMSSQGQPVGMAVGSFTSVSLDPPLVAFLPAASSKTWPQIEAAGSFCVNILSARQEALSRNFSRSTTDKFMGVPWFPSPSGAPILEDALAWIDCSVFRVDEAGDHFIVLGRVTEMRLQTATEPLVFFRGGYGRFDASSLVAGDPRGDLFVPLNLVELGRPELERFTERTNTQCAVTALVGDQVVVIAAAGGVHGAPAGTFVGGRVRAVPPIGTTFMAWESSERVAAWMSLARPADGEALKRRVAAMKRRGMAVSLEGGGVPDWQNAFEKSAADEVKQEAVSRLTQTFDPQAESDAARVRNLHVPVFGPDGRAGLFLNIGGFPPLDKSALAELIADAQSVAARISSMAKKPTAATKR